MIETLTEELVEKTWREFADISPDLALKETSRVARLQPNLLPFLVELTEELDPDAKELALYLFYIVHRIFEKGYGKLGRVSERELIECFEKNERFFESLQGIHEKFFERIALIQISEQPYVMRHVLKTLFEEDKEELSLSEGEIGFIFLLIKTVIDVLNKKAGVTPQTRK